jgi:gluconolactonase
MIRRTPLIAPLSALAAVLAASAVARAGHETPSYIDGCQSKDGRFVITAEPVADPAAGAKGGPPKPNPVHGPLKWRFTWRDTQSGKSHSFEPQGLSAGSIYAQLFMAPDGETFALFNPLKFHTSGKSDMHGKPAVEKGLPGYETQENFSRRIIVYRKDGSVVRELGVADLLKPAEWDSVGCVFGRVEWLREYPGFRWKVAPRVPYPFCRVSPDYTVLELRPVAAKGDKTGGRTVRVCLTDGRILPDDEKIADPDKVPVRPFVGPDIVPEGPDRARMIDGYRPSLDPARTAGTFPDSATPKATAEKAPGDGDAAPRPSAPAEAPLELVKDGLTKADTPTWLPGEKCLLFADLDGAKTYRLDPPSSVTVARPESARGKAGPDGRLYAQMGNKLVAWKPGAEPEVILEAAAGGRELSLNDLAVSPDGRFLYFTTLKDPEKGRLSVVDLKARTVSIAFDGESEPTLWNPNGVAVSADGKWLYVGVSSYKNRKASAVYRFPLGTDGTPDVSAGKSAPWAAIAGTDGIAAAPDGSVLVTVGGEVAVLSAEGRKLRSIKVPRGSGTNLCLGGDDGRTLFVTTNNALYRGRY